MMLAQFRMPALAVAIGVAAVVAPVLSLVAPAEAAAGGHGGGAPAGAHARAVSVTDSDHFAGYEAAVTGATTSAAQFKIPALSCTSASRAITPVAGVSVNVGTTATYSSAFLFVGCQSGKALYFPALVVNGTETNYNTTHLAAGDVVKVSTKVTSGTTVQVTDVTKGITKKLTGPAATPTSAYIADSGWYVNGSPLGVPKFGTLTFSHCAVDGKTLASAHPTKVQRVNPVSHVVQISTGALSPAGTSFATHFKHA
jgi:hypothetical protein